MKKLDFMFVMVLVFLFGCSTDDMSKTEQQLPKDKNNQQELAKPSRVRAVKIAFKGTSINDAIFVTDCLPSERKLLKNGQFSGYIKGFGTIKTNLSPYEFTACSVKRINPPNQGETNMYVLKSEGQIVISTSDRLYFTINTNLYPWDTTGDFIGTATINSGVGKFLGATGTLEVINSGLSGYGVDFVTGEVNMYLSGTITVPN